MTVIRASQNPKGAKIGTGSTECKVGPENTTKSWPFKTENNAQTLPKQLLQSNFEKVQKMTFSTPKIAKNEPPNCQKWFKFD